MSLENARFKTVKPTVPGFDAAIEVRGKMFNLKSVKENGGFTHIDIHDDKGQFLDEYASGFPIGVHGEDGKDFELASVETYTYIDENLVF